MDYHLRYGILKGNTTVYRIFFQKKYLYFLHGSYGAMKEYDIPGLLFALCRSNTLYAHLIVYGILSLLTITQRLYTQLVAI